ncbi:MAG: DUF2207 family protein [Anaerolineae bacterium]
MLIHNRSRQWHWFAWLPVALLIAATIVSLAAVAPAGAQSSKVYHWSQYDYDVQILNNGDMLFTVDMVFSFDQGSFSQGFFAFDTGRIEDVQDVEVWEGDRRYREVGEESTYGYQVSGGDLFEVLWWFPPTEGAERAFTLKYRVVGGLRIYEAGDQFFWNFWSGDRGASIERGLIMVHLPAAFTADQVRIASDPATVLVDPIAGDIVRASVVDFPPNTTAVLRIQFPHGAVTAAPPTWQAADDRLVAYQERWKPVVDLGILGLSALVLFGGVGGVIALWYSRGRDKPVGLVAEYLTEPPSTLQPGLAGVLVDERADVRDIVATIVDLGSRGVLTIEEVEEKTIWGIGSKKDFVYRLEKRDATLLPFEQQLISEFFGRGTERRLSDLKEKFYTAIPRITKLMYEDLTQRQFFTANPEMTRRRWRGIGVAGLVISGVLLFCGSAALAQYTSFAFCLPLSSAAAFLVLTIVGGAMPRRTEQGAEETARWQAFKRYLDDIDRYDDVAAKAAIFERFLPYAIAFGVEKSYIGKFSRVDTPAPRWYYPYPPIILGPGMGMGRGTTGGGLPTTGGGMTTPTLQGMSNSMSSSLQGMSDGLVSMLNSASSTLTSAPRSSGSSGGGWSGGGGGFGGGGGGGGGSGAR